MTPPFSSTWTMRWILRGSGWAGLTESSIQYEGRELLLERFAAPDDLHQLLRNRGLAGLVVLEREGVDHLLRVLRGRVHRRHARPELARLRLVERAEDRDVEVHGD